MNEEKIKKLIEEERELILDIEKTEVYWDDLISRAEMEEIEGYYDDDLEACKVHIELAKDELQIVRQKLKTQEREEIIDVSKIHFIDDEFGTWKATYRGKRNGTLVTAKVRDYHENGQLYQEETYKDGELEGISKEWYENCELKLESIYKNGISDGVSKGWHENGQLKHESAYKEGKVEGVFKLWFENGQLEHESIYKNGKLDGVWKEWYPNGSLNGEAMFKEGKQEGVAKKWDEDGNLIKKATYQDGKQISDL